MARKPKPAEFLGTQMANMLALLATGNKIPPEYRKEATKLYERWDRTVAFHINNPIVAAELERALFPNG
jgi:hypothetical protein